MSYDPSFVSNHAVVLCLQQAKEDWQAGHKMNPFSAAGEWLNPRHRQAAYHDALKRSAFQCFVAVCGSYVTGETTAALGTTIVSVTGEPPFEAWPEADTLAAFDAAIELAWGPEYRGLTQEEALKP